MGFVSVGLKIFKDEVEILNEFRFLDVGWHAIFVVFNLCSEDCEVCVVNIAPTCVI